ncbi:MAG: hypothetical protein B7Z72_13470, partial [Gemmatimonadetes bacterium 21-71-4]
DWLRAADHNTRFLSVSRKDRGAILPIGTSRGPVFWLSPSTGLMTTSRYYADTLPSWVQRFNARKIPQSYAGKAWTPLLAPDAYPEPDSVPIEAMGRDYAFPHVLSDDPQAAVAGFANYPWMDEMTLSLALDEAKQPAHRALRSVARSRDQVGDGHENIILSVRESALQEGRSRGLGEPPARGGPLHRI